MKLRLVVLAIMLLVALTGCPPFEMVSWSPNGRYLAFIGPDDSKLWIWDTSEDKAIAKKWEVDTDVVHCRFVTDDELIIFRKRGEDTYDLYMRNIKKETWKVLVHDTSIEKYDVSQDGRYLYYVKQIESEGEGKDSGTTIAEVPDGKQPKEGEPTKRYALVRKDLRKQRPEKVLFTCENDFSYLNVDASGRRILFCGEIEGNDGFHAYEKTTGKIRHLMPVEDPEYGMWPKWVDDHRIIYIRMTDEDSKGSSDEETFGTLVLRDFTNNCTKELCPYVFPFDPPSLNADRTKVVVTGAVKDLSKDEDAADDLSTWQVVSVDLETCERRVLTSEPFGACRAAYDREGNRVAYLSPFAENDNEVATVRILDLETNRTTVVWRDEEEHLLAKAAGLEQDGEFQEALDTYKELIKRFPDMRFADPAHYHVLML